MSLHGGTIFGTVRDAATGETLPGVSVSWYVPRGWVFSLMGTTTDLDGNYAAQPFGPVTFRFVGRKPYVWNGSPIGQRVDVLLEHDTNLLAEAVVTAQRPRSWWPALIGLALAAVLGGIINILPGK